MSNKERLSQLYKELVVAYANVAKKVANNTARCPNIKFEHEMESKKALKSLFYEFLQGPTEQKFQSLWNRNYIWAATMGGNATNLINKHGLNAITEVLKEVDAATEYNPDWEHQLGASGALSEFWGKLKDKPIRNECANHALVFLGLENPRSYPDFLDEFKQFEVFYQANVGQDKVTAYPIEVELDQLFNFVDKATDTDLVENPDIDDEDVKTLYAIKKQIDDVLRPPGAAPVYWVEKRDLKRHPYLESGEYALGKALLSSQTSVPDPQGHVKDIYRAMREVKPGDVVLHLTTDSEAFSGVSIVASAVDDSFVWPEEDKKPGGPGYLVWLKDYTHLDSPINKREFLEDSHVFEQLSQISEQYKKRKYREDYPGGLFYDTKVPKIGEGGYLTRAPPEVVEILNNIYKQKTGQDLPHKPPHPPRKSWIFQARPDRYKLIEHLRPQEQVTWAANKMRDQMEVGDTVYYWQSGSDPAIDPGIYGVGKLESRPERGLAEPEFGDWGVMTRVERCFGDHYISKQAFLENPILRESTIMRGPEGTNFRLTRAQASEIEKLIPPPMAPTNVIFFGPPGTGKTYKAINRALEIVYDDPEHCKNPEKTRDQLIAEFNQLQAKGQVEFITFHQSYSYEEFIEGIRPVLETDNEASNLSYKLKKGVFWNIAEAARSPQGCNKNFVLIIDEINRGNIPKVFGELITLIEEDKREGGENAVAVRLPYSDDMFTVPANLHIIGTMNSADRSIALMDLALRRRFTFIPFMPEYEETGLNDEYIDDLNLGALLQKLNLKIQVLVDKDHQIGHSYFIDVKKATNKTQKLYDVWYNEIVPLLEEYFYNDYERLGYLLDPYDKEHQIGFVENADLTEIKPLLDKIGLDDSDFPAGTIYKYKSPEELVAALKSYAK
jgi:hypothetical protein